MPPWPHNMSKEKTERHVLGQRIHDGIAQKLTAVSMNLTDISREANALSADRRDLLQGTGDLLKEALAEIRAISHELMDNN